MSEGGAHTFGDVQVTVVVTGAWRENCYVIRHLRTNEQLIVDPGDDAATIASTVTMGSGGPVRGVLLTHAHHDHVGAVADVCRRFGVPCDVHRGDVRLLRQAPMYALRFAGKPIEAPSPFRAFDERPPLTFAGEAVQVIHTPGHTPGSVCYRWPGFLVTGDTLLHERVGRTDLPGGDASRLADSVEQLLETLPDDTVILAGHGPAWNVARARTWWQAAGGARAALGSREA